MMAKFRCFRIAEHGMPEKEFSMIGKTAGFPRKRRRWTDTSATGSVLASGSGATDRLAYAGYAAIFWLWP
jgi:hypothetical protein